MSTAATKDQKLQIRRNCNYQEDIKCEWVQWVTKDISKTSLNDLNFDQANKIIAQQTGTKYTPENWAFFDKNNKKHKVILSLLYQAKWVKNDIKRGEIPDLDRLSNFLKSKSAPVQKKLMEQSPVELEKTIKALNGIIKHTYSK